MPFTDINTVVCATVRKLRNIYLKGRNEEVEIWFYNKCWGQHQIGADFSIIFLQNKSI